MSKLLYIQSSPRGQRSHSVAVTDAFIEAYERKNPDDEIEILNVFDESIPNFDGLAVQAKYTILHGKSHSQVEQEVWKDVEQMISIPYRLKQYIDLLVQPGYTFSYSPEAGYQGLVSGKPMLAVFARGGEYPPGSEAEAFDLQTKYIELIFGFIGFTDIRSVVAEPTLQSGPDVAGVKRQGAIEKVKEIAEVF
jgi:FMN-dependent NADH-azoreductase